MAIIELTLVIWVALLLSSLLSVVLTGLVKALLWQAHSKKSNCSRKKLGLSGLSSAPYTLSSPEPLHTVFVDKK